MKKNSKHVPHQDKSSEPVVADVSSPEISPSMPSPSFKEKAGDAANRWMAKNRSLVLRQTPVWAQTLTAIVLGIGTFGLLASIVIKIDEVVTVQGQLKSIGGTVEVKTPAGGQISEVLYEDGEYVEKNQLLLRFDTRQATDEKETYTKLIASERTDLQKRLTTLDSNQKILKDRLEVARKKLKTNKMILDELKTLTDIGGFQKIQFLERQDQVLALESSVAEVGEQLNQLDLQRSRTILDASKNIDQMSSQLKSANLQLQYQTVRAPVSGVIFDPQATKDGVLGAGQRILSIVPQKGLYAEVFVPNEDIGFIKIGQSSKIRVLAFPFTQYGELSGSVAQISADALEPDETMNIYRFPVKINLDNDKLISRGVEIPLKSGMAITSNLKLREKRLISLISDLLVDQTDSIRGIRQQ